MAVPAPAPPPKITGLQTPFAVVESQFCVPYNVELIMTEKAMSLLDGASSNVKDSDGNLVLKLKGRCFGLHEKRWLCDPNGVRLLTVQKKMRTMHSRWNMYRGDSTDEKDLICTIKTPKLIQWKTDQYHIFLAGNTSNEKDCDLKVKDKNSQMFFYLGDTDKILAKVKKRESIKTELLGQDSYRITVYANMDYAFVVAMTTILDDIGDDAEDISDVVDDIGDAAEDISDVVDATNNASGAGC